jgi:hypothetical protein
MDVKEFARLGGLARAKSMTARERRELATKASRAAALARKKKAKQKQELVDRLIAPVQAEEPVEVTAARIHRRRRSARKAAQARWEKAKQKSS